uniref:Uncharacterized protein n=1 Tax=Anopheles christyi TaxID=43041 RepID=A0A182JP12_9DIPT
MSKFLSLRRPTTISKLAPLIPQHPDALPREIVPQWADLLPSAKLPDRCCPVHAKDFSRGALAQAILEFPHGHGFDLQDPGNRVVQRTYQALHDKHLREFWNDVLKKNLKRRGFINSDERVMCTLMEFNKYRNFLFQHYRLQLQRLLQKLGSEKANDDHNMRIQTHMETVPDFDEKLAIKHSRAAGIFNKKMDIKRYESRQYLESFLKQMRHKVQDRKEMYERKHNKMEQELVRRKTRNLTSKYYRRSKAALVKALQRECKKSILAKGSSGRAANLAQERIDRAIDAAYAIHTAISPTTSSTQIIDTASQFVLDLRDIPVEPLPQDQLITGYVVDRLREIMNDIVDRSVQEARELIEQVAIRKTESLNQDELMVRSSLSSQGSIPKLPSFQVRSERYQSRVSMGPVAIVEQYETESFSLKKCRNRPPTPVTSVTSLVERTLRQSHEERVSISALEVTNETALDVLQRIQSNDYPLIHVMHSQRRYLEGNILKYRMILQPCVDQRVLAAIDLERLAIVRDFEEGDSGTTAAARETILQCTASALLRFPESNRQYAIALFDSVHLLSVQAIRKIQQILNAP